MPREVGDPLRPSSLKTTPQSTPQRIPQRTPHRTPPGTPQGAPQGTPRWDSYSENPMKRSSSGSTGGTSLEDGAPPRICPQGESRGISPWAPRCTPQRCFAGASQGASQGAPPQ